MPQNRDICESIELVDSEKFINFAAVFRKMRGERLISCRFYS